MNNQSQESLALGIRENLPQFVLLIIVNAFVGAILAGAIADMPGIAVSMWFIAAITFLSGTVVLFRMQETISTGSPLK